MAYNIGLTGPQPYQGAIENDFFASLVNWFANRNPLVARLPNRPVSGTIVRAVDDAFRPSVAVLNAAITDADATTIAVSNTPPNNGTGPFMAGDVIQIDNELIRIEADPAPGTNLTVTRGVADTTPATHLISAVVHLIGNTRTGAEVEPGARKKIWDLTDTVPQVSQHPYKIGGELEASSGNAAIPLGLPSILGWDRFKKSQELMDDFERSLYYGQYVPYAAGDTRVMMRGLRQRFATNRVTSPTNASSYKPEDLIRDSIERCVAGGGQPDVMLVSTNFMTGIAKWGHALQVLDPGTTEFGTRMDVFYAPFLEGITVIKAPLLRPGTVITLTSSEVYMGWKREPRDESYGRRGDAFEGDVIGSGCVVANNEAHHAWTEGITGFAAV